MKISLAPEVRKSVPELAFIFDKSNFLDLINFDFLDLIKFATVDRFLILLPTLLPSALLVTLGRF